MRLTVRKDDLEVAVRLMAASKRDGLLNLSFDGNLLEFRRGRSTARLPAQGHWPGTTRVPVAFLKDLLRRMSALPDEVVIVGQEQSIHISHYRIPAIFQ